MGRFGYTLGSSDSVADLMYEIRSDVDLEKVFKYLNYKDPDCKEELSLFAVGVVAYSVSKFNIQKVFGSFGKVTSRIRSIKKSYVNKVPEAKECLAWYMDLCLRQKYRKGGCLVEFEILDILRDALESQNRISSKDNKGGVQVSDSSGIAVNRIFEEFKGFVKNLNLVNGIVNGDKKLVNSVYKEDTGKRDRLISVVQNYENGEITDDLDRDAIECIEIYSFEKGNDAVLECYTKYYDIIGKCGGFSDSFFLAYCSCLGDLDRSCKQDVAGGFYLQKNIKRVKELGFKESDFKELCTSPKNRPHVDILNKELKVRSKEALSLVGSYYRGLDVVLYEDDILGSPERWKDKHVLFNSVMYMLTEDSQRKIWDLIPGSKNNDDFIKAARWWLDSNVLDFVKGVSDEEQKRVVGLAPTAIKFIENPSESIQEIAVSEDPSVIEHMENPCVKAQEIAVKSDGSLIKHIKNPSEDIQLLAVQDVKSAIEYIENPYPSVIHFTETGELPSGDVVKAMSVDQLRSMRDIFSGIRKYCKTRSMYGIISLYENSGITYLKMPDNTLYGYNNGKIKVLKCDSNNKDAASKENLGTVKSLIESTVDSLVIRMPFKIKSVSAKIDIGIFQKGRITESKKEKGSVDIKLK